MPRILILDIETFPNVAYVWKFWKENVGAKQVIEHSSLASFAYKWLGEDIIYYAGADKHTEKALLSALIKLLDMADIVVAHNGDRFDLPTIKGRALVMGLRPPSPFKTIDTCLVARYEFNYGSNSLEYLADILGLAPKLAHKNFPGFTLWKECLAGNPKAWEEMEVYNKQDVDTLEQVYLTMRPYMRRHPNVAVDIEDDRPLCPKCGSHHIQMRGFTTTNTYKYRKFQCRDCGGWSRTRFNEFPKEKKHALLVNTN